MSDHELRELERRAAAGDAEARTALERARARAGLPGLAIISDVHGNLEALTAVLADIDRQGISDVLCLGDLVGFGPNPVECIDLVMSRCRVTLKGDFEERLTSPITPMNAHAQEAHDWLIGLLRPGFLARGVARQRWEFLEQLPVRHSDAATLYVHGSPRAPTTEYVLAAEIAHGYTEKFLEIFGLIDRRVFVGHTHIPGVITEDLQSKTAAELPGARWSQSSAGKAIINVGSVGQPRDQDNRACYVTVSGGVIEWHRVAYDLAATVEKIRRVPALDDSFALRLTRGV